MTPGPALMGILFIALFCLLNGQGQKDAKILVLCSAFTLYMSSNIFPWDYITDHFMIGELLSQIQFPWRYIGIAIVFLTLLVGVVHKELISGSKYQWQYESVITGSCIVMSCLFLSNYNDDARFINWQNTEEINTYWIGSNAEYLRWGSGIEDLSTELSCEDVQEVSVVEREGSDMVLYARGMDECDGAIVLPIFYYKGYHVVDEAGHEYVIEDGHNKQIRFIVPKGFEGNIMISFEEPWYWRAAELISLISILGVIYLQFKPMSKR